MRNFKNTKVFIILIIFSFNAEAEPANENIEKKNSWTFSVENDLLACSQKDADYTGGFMYTISGPDASRLPLSLDPILGAVDHLWLPGHDIESSAKAGFQVSMQSWTPYDKEDPLPVRDDRPYATLLALTSTRMMANPDDEAAWASSLTLGLLGAGFAENIHNGIHDLARCGPGPKGYHNQISHGGEPTMRYSLRHQSFLGEKKFLNARHDFKFGVEGSVGYLTEASLGLSARLGRFSTPWWSMQAEHHEFYAPNEAQGNFYLSYGMELKLRGYNALLQGQFRHSEVTVPRSNLETVIGVAWFGLTWGITNTTTLTYQMRRQTPEIKSGAGSRYFSSGGIYLKHVY